MSCNCNCKNGSDVQDFLLSSETAGVYVLGLTHYTCGNRKMLLADAAHPVISDLQVSPVGQPVDVGNAMYRIAEIGRIAMDYAAYLAGTEGETPPAAEASGDEPAAMMMASAW